MTLTTVPRYDSSHTSRAGGHAVVVGASMAGLLAARILTDAFDEVTVLDRDDLPDEPVTRRGVPQGRHVHVLLAAGQATLEDLFPGYGEELIGAGGLVIDATSDLEYYAEGDFLATGPKRTPMYCASRPLIERTVRRRVAELEGARVRPGCQFVDFLVDDAASTVGGVTIRNEDGKREELAAELVVDATGRTSRTPVWLAKRGYAPPAVDEVHVDVAYSTVLIERPEDDRRAFFVPPSPARTRGCGAFPIEGGRWIVTVQGLHGDTPPTDGEGVVDFVRSLSVPEVTKLLETHLWISENVAHYPFPSNRRNRYDELDQFPEGVVVIGDAIASFNPIYGQGMSVAALEALALHHALAVGGCERLALRFFDRVAPIVDIPWTIAVGGDFQFPQTAGPKPRGSDLFNWYLSHLIRAAHSDGNLTDAFLRVLSMERVPTTLLHPDVVWRVFKPAPRSIGILSRDSSRTPATVQEEIAESGPTGDEERSIDDRIANR